MIEKIILDYLDATLSIGVYMQVPNPAPASYVLIEKTGSRTEDMIHEATFAIQSISDSLYNAAQLNEEVKAAMNNITTIDKVGKSKLNSDYNFTDTETKAYRYQAVYDVIY